jgi:competence protein ComGC
MKILGYVLAVFAIFLALYLFLKPNISIDVVSAKGTSEANQVRSLIQAIKIYALDKKTYPKTLNELTTQNYLSQNDFSKLTDNLKYLIHRLHP